MASMINEWNRLSFINEWRRWLLCEVTVAAVVATDDDDEFNFVWFDMRAGKY